MPEAKKRSRRLLFAFVALATLGAVFLLSGSLLVDRVVSFLISRQLSCSVKCRGAHFDSPREVSFVSLSVYSKDKRLLLSSAGGGFFWGKHAASLRLRRAVFREGIFGILVPAGMTQWLQAIQRPLTVESLLLLVDRGKNVHAVHFTARGEESVVYLRGGLQFMSGRLLKGHALVRVPEEWLEEIPAGLRPGGIKKGHGWAELKIFVGENSLRLMGENGPLFEAGWRS